MLAATCCAASVVVWIPFLTDAPKAPTAAVLCRADCSCMPSRWSEVMDSKAWSTARDGIV